MSRPASQALHDAKADERQRRAQEFDDWCALSVRLIRLAENLRVAGALTVSFDLGRRYADDLWDTDAHGRLWHPNVNGKGAPGGRGAGTAPLKAPKP